MGRTVDRIASSNFDQTCGFLVVFALSGQKIQVFCRSTDLVWRVEGWLKGRLAETGNSCICVRRLDGNSTAAQKKRVMEDFRTGSVSVLFCTEVAAMGVHCPDLCLGVSLGAWTTRWTTRWKCVQTSAPPAEREEARAVRGIYSSEQCLRASLYQSFRIENPAVIYTDLLTTESQERCAKCNCCTNCQVTCNCVALWKVKMNPSCEFLELIQTVQ